MSVAQVERADRVLSDERTSEARIVAAVLECISRSGVAKTTSDDIARAAGISRATLYRAVPGGREVLFDLVLRHETARFFGTVAARLDDAADLEDLLVIGIHQAADFLLGHRALRALLDQEPELVVPSFAFNRVDHVLEIAVGFTAPHLARFLGASDTTQRRADWLVRLLISYVVTPSRYVDLTDPVSVRGHVRAFVLPVLQFPDPRSPKESRACPPTKS